MHKYLFILWLLIAATSFSSAQTPEAATAQTTTTTETPEVEMADTMRQDGKIYVVVAVIVTVLVGLVFYLIRLDRKVNKLEQQLKS